MKKHFIKQFELVRYMAFLLLLTFVVGLNMSSAFAEEKPIMPDIPDTKATKVEVAEKDSFVSGEVKSVREFEDNLLLVLVEWPVVIKLDGSTIFKGKAGQTVSIYSAKELLVGQAVKIFKKTNENGEFVAEKIVVLEYEDLQKLRKLRPERMKQHSNKQKDAKKKI